MYIHAVYTCNIYKSIWHKNAYTMYYNHYHTRMQHNNIYMYV